MLGSFKQGVDKLKNDPANQQRFDQARQRVEERVLQAAEWAEERTPEVVKQQISKTIEKLQRLKF